MTKPRIVTLFGEELIPEELQVAPKPGPVSVDGQEAKRKGIAWESWQPEKQYYTIGEVAALFGLRTSHIRSWTNEFALQVRTTKKGDRLYTPANIGELRAIYHLVKECGFTLAGARAKLKSPEKNMTETLDLRQSLLKLRNQLLQIRNGLV